MKVSSINIADLMEATLYVLMISLFKATKYQIPRLQTNPSGFNSTSFVSSIFLYLIFKDFEFHIALCNTERYLVLRIDMIFRRIFLFFRKLYFFNFVDNFRKFNYIIDLTKSPKE